MRFIVRAMLATIAALCAVPVLTGAASGDSAGAGIALATPLGARALSAPVAGAPGTTDERLADVELVGPGSVGVLTMTVERIRTSALDQTALHYAVERCATAWTRTGETYTCPTTPQVLRAPAPLGPRADLFGLGGIGAGGVAHLLVRFGITPDAPRAVIGQSSTLEFRVTAAL